MKNKIYYIYFDRHYFIKTINLFNENIYVGSTVKFNDLPNILIKIPHNKMYEK